MYWIYFLFNKATIFLSKKEKIHPYDFLFFKKNHVIINTNICTFYFKKIYLFLKILVFCGFFGSNLAYIEK